MIAVELGLRGGHLRGLWLTQLSLERVSENIRPQPGPWRPSRAGVIPSYDSWKSLSEKMQNSLTLGNPLAVLDYILVHSSKGATFQLETSAHPGRDCDK